MMKKSLLLAAVIIGIGGVTSSAVAEGGTQAWASPPDNCPELMKGQTVIYKWKKNGVVQYSKRLPYGYSESQYEMINQYGMEIPKDCPMDDGQGNSNIIRPIRAETPVAQSSASGQPVQGTQEPVPGTITKEQRCDTARKNVQMIQTRKTIYEDDGNGNLVPLSDAIKEQRLADAQKIVSETCGN